MAQRRSEEPEPQTEDARRKGAQDVEGCPSPAWRGDGRGDNRGQATRPRSLLLRALSLTRRRPQRAAGPLPARRLAVADGGAHGRSGSRAQRKRGADSAPERAGTLSYGIPRLTLLSTQPLPSPSAWLASNHRRRPRQTHERSSRPTAPPLAACLPRRDLPSPSRLSPSPPPPRSPPPPPREPLYHHPLFPPPPPRHPLSMPWAEDPEKTKNYDLYTLLFPIDERGLHKVSERVGSMRDTGRSVD